ncbi:MAG: hypothetical protein HPY46_06550 [Candidatus Aminicenantes bacterium]|nr:hypothetical protein [Candidatus Aminicenantes bacterium]
MNFWQWLLMVLGWASAGLLLSARVIFFRRSIITDPSAISPGCPKLSYKCWLGAAASIVYGVAWYHLMGLKDDFTSGGYLVSLVVAAVFGATLAQILCPRPAPVD